MTGVQTCALPIFRVYDAEITELYQRAITEAAQANLFDEEARTQLIQQGILQYDEESKRFQVSKQKTTYFLDSVGKVMGALSAGAMTYGSLGVGTRAFVGSPMSAANKNILYKSHEFEPLHQKD